MTTRICYHCAQREALPRSNFCSECNKNSRPLFFPEGERKGKWKTVVLYVLALGSLVYLSYETVKFLLTH